MSTPDREAFLQRLFAGCTETKIELRALPANGEGRPVQNFSTLTNAAWREEFVARHRATHNLYVGIADRRDASSGALANCVSVGGLHVDLDFKDTPEVEARRLVRACPVQPSISLRSGGGVQLYYLFRDRVPVTDPRLVPVLRRLARAVGGDLSAAEAARVMRLPGTVNYKYDPPRPVELTLWRPERQVVLAELTTMLPLDPESWQPVDRPAFTLPPVIDANRNSTLYKLGRSMKARGNSPDAIAAALEAENCSRCQPPLEATELHDLIGKVVHQSDRPLPPRQTPAAAALLEQLAAPANGRTPPEESLASGEPSAHEPDLEPAPAPASESESSAAGRARSPRWTLHDAADPWQFPAPDFLVDQLLPSTGVVWIGGQPHAGKSLLALYSCLAIACKRPSVAAHFAVRQSPRILFVSREDGGSRLQARRDEILAAWGCQPAPGALRFLIREPVNLQDPSDMAALVATCKQDDIRVLVLDTWTALAPGSDPANPQAQADLARAVVALAAAIDGLVVVIDHLRKNPPDGSLSVADIYGPTQKAQRAEHAIVLRRLEGHADPRRVEVLIDGKDLDATVRFYLDRSPAGSGLEKFTYGGTVQAAAEKQRTVGQENRERVYGAVPAARPGATLEELANRLTAAKTPLSQTTLRTHLRALIAAGRVQKVGRTTLSRFWRTDTADGSVEGPSREHSTESA